ncbi:MAG: hypothetical protein OEZ43_08685 [Gammaproteobacteria bacterium]|nr:hypothetical protein [Gammaproteobacteria bacterium]
MSSEMHCCCDMNSMSVTKTQYTHTVVSTQISVSSFNQSLATELLKPEADMDSVAQTNRQMKYRIGEHKGMLDLIPVSSSPWAKQGLERFFLLASMSSESTAETKVNHLVKNSHANCVLEYLAQSGQKCHAEDV